MNIIRNTNGIKPINLFEKYIFTGTTEVINQIKTQELNIEGKQVIETIQYYPLLLRF